jgi:hypothetical protein
MAELGRNDAECQSAGVNQKARCAMQNEVVKRGHSGTAGNNEQLQRKPQDMLRPSVWKDKELYDHRHAK